MRKPKMHSLAPTITSPLPLLSLLLLCLTASAQDLHDAGYGDDSLVDSSGQYYYRQANGSYMDVYGSTYSPIGEGLYTDALGNLLDAGTDAPTQPQAVVPTPGTEPDTEAAPDADAPTARAPDRKGANRPRTPPGTGKTHALAPETPDGVSPKPGETGDFGPRYLEEVGDGYLKIDPDEIAADPRLAAPHGAPARAGKRAGPARSPKGLDASDLDLHPGPGLDGRPAQDVSPDADPQDLSPVDRGQTGWRPSPSAPPSR